jgi:hypothetical protein
MATTWTTNLRNLLTAGAEIGPKSGLGRNLAEYFTEIVVAATTAMGRA